MVLVFVSYSPGLDLDKINHFMLHQEKLSNQVIVVITVTLITAMSQLCHQ